MLTKMLEEAGTLKNYTLPEQQIYMRLAYKFQESTQFLFQDPEELTAYTGIGTPDQWKELLSFNETQAYIKGTMAFLSQIAQRKTFQSLLTTALEGNQQAAKQIQELSGIMNQQDSNRTIILHRVPRPEVK